MGTENFTRIQSATAWGDDRVIDYTRVGEPVTGIRLAGQPVGDNIAPAGLFSTAPYVPDQPKPVGISLAKIEQAVHDEEQPPEDLRINKCMGNDDTCNAWATKKYGGMFCNAHGRVEAGLSAYAPRGG